ncbi:peptidoglycan editing factor PgeF [Sphingomonas sp.]|uniref:peptidoglycan editing factor PgeF n=1 Tax=Sphingomonas sp. TaxID=28214 RepID=UPI00286E195B|nr:peptidoglycan editing factor PgeF [Sphingomonas sp.]
MSVEVIHAPALGAVAHGFLGRGGGVSTGALAGLNVGYGSSDDRDAIAENRRRAVDAVLPGGELTTVHQVHSALCVEARQAWPHDARPHADAMVTATPGLLLGILTADCAPVLFADRRGEVIGAAHAGWRGALAGVTDATIAAMESLGARREHVAAAVGPCIARDSYEVDETFRTRFLDEDGDNARFFTLGPAGKPHFDLPGYVAHRLVAAGVGTVATLGLDTYADAARFFSYRRATHSGEFDYGRQLSVIGISARA